MDQVSRVAREKQEQLMKLPNVVGVGVGFKTTKGKETDRLSVVVLVERKLPKDALTPQALVPEELDGVPTDVIEVGRLRPLGKLGAEAVSNLEAETWKQVQIRSLRPPPGGGCPF